MRTCMHTHPLNMEAWPHSLKPGNKHSESFKSVPKAYFDFRGQAGAMSIAHVPFCENKQQLPYALS